MQRLFDGHKVWECEYETNWNRDKEKERKQREKENRFLKLKENRVKVTYKQMREEVRNEAKKHKREQKDEKLISFQFVVWRYEWQVSQEIIASSQMQLIKIRGTHPPFLQFELI